MSLMAATLIPFIFLHGSAGQEIRINARAIASLRDPAKNTGEHFGNRVRCLVFMTDGKFISVLETCPAIAEMMRPKP